MKKLIYASLLLIFCSCEGLGLKKPCYTCTTTYYDPSTGLDIKGMTPKKEEVCGNDEMDNYRKNNKGVHNGIGQFIQCK